MYMQCAAVCMQCTCSGPRGVPESEVWVRVRAWVGLSLLVRVSGSRGVKDSGGCGTLLPPPYVATCDMLLPAPYVATCYFALPTPYSLLPTPYSLLPTPYILATPYRWRTAEAASTRCCAPLSSHPNRQEQERICICICIYLSHPNRQEQERPSCTAKTPRTHLHTYVHTYLHTHLRTYIRTYLLTHLFTLT